MPCDEERRRPVVARRLLAIASLAAIAGGLALSLLLPTLHESQVILTNRGPAARRSPSFLSRFRIFVGIETEEDGLASRVRDRLLEWQRVQHAIEGGKVDFGREVDLLDRKGIEALHREIAASVRVASVGDGRMAVTCRTTDPQRSADLANQLIEHYSLHKTAWRREREKRRVMADCDYYNAKCKLAIDVSDRALGRRWELEQVRPWLEGEGKEWRREYDFAQECELLIRQMIVEQEATVEVLRGAVEPKGEALTVQAPVSPEHAEAEKRLERARLKLEHLNERRIQQSNRVLVLYVNLRRFHTDQAERRTLEATAPEAYRTRMEYGIGLDATYRALSVWERENSQASRSHTRELLFEPLGDTVPGSRPVSRHLPTVLMVVGVLGGVASCWVKRRRNHMSSAAE